MTKLPYFALPLLITPEKGKIGNTKMVFFKITQKPRIILAISKYQFVSFLVIQLFPICIFYFFIIISISCSIRKDDPDSDYWQYKINFILIDTICILFEAASDVLVISFSPDIEDTRFIFIYHIPVPLLLLI